MSAPADGNPLPTSAASLGFHAALVEELASHNHDRRASGCQELGHYLREGQTEAITVLIAALGDSHPVVRVTAAEALATGPGEPIEAALLEAIGALARETRPGHRASLVHALGLLDRPVQGALLDALLDEAGRDDQDVRFHAVTSLNRLECRDSRFAEALPRLLDDPDDEVAAIAATSAAELDLAELRERVVQRWRTARGFARRHLALAAAHFGSDEVVDTLERAMREGFDALEAVDALVALASEASCDALHRAARSWRVHPIVRARAGVALLEVGHPDGARIVDKQLDHRRHDIRWSTLEWLGRAGLSAWRDKLVARLDDPGGGDSVAAAAALGALADETSIEALRRASTNDLRQDVREEAESAIAAATQTHLETRG